jgi:membrane associated rhomboid family serine protease
MKNITTSKFILGLVWTLFGVLAFGYVYFNVVRKDWSLPVAIVLGLVYGLIGFWIVRRSGRNSRQAKK